MSYLKVSINTISSMNKNVGDIDLCIKNLYSESPEEYKKWVTIDAFHDFLKSDWSNHVFYDYETGGIDPVIDAPMQCALIRTDPQLRIIDIPLDLYCRPNSDRYPHPDAILLTKINIDSLFSKGLPEPVFFKKIQEEFTKFPRTCITGFNSIKYDDEMTRFSFYRNMLPAYLHEFSDGNSRLDVYKLVLAVFACDKDSMQWPIVSIDGNEKISFKLEHLAKENGLLQENAHNAVSDVLATIQLSKLILEKSPHVYKDVMLRRFKSFNESLVSIFSQGVIVSPFAGQECQYLMPIVSLGPSRENKNKIICINVSNIESVRHMYTQYKKGIDITPFLHMKKEDLQSLQLERPPIVTFELNKLPLYWPITAAECPSISIDYESVKKLQDLFNSTDGVTFRQYIMQAAASNLPDEADIQLRLYSGFPTRKDDAILKSNVQKELREMLENPSRFDSETLNKLQVLMFAKYLESTQGLDKYPDIKLSWIKHCNEQYNSPSQRLNKPRINRDCLRELLNDPKYIHLQKSYAFWLDQ